MRNIRNELANAGSVLEGKFFFALKKPGTVSCKYINMDPVFTQPTLITEIGVSLAEPWTPDNIVFVAPAVGGIPLLYAASDAHLLNPRIAWADKKSDGSFCFERMGFSKVVRGASVVILEDIVSTWSSGDQVRKLVEQEGGRVVGASIIWNRGKITAESAGLPVFHSLVDEPVEVFKVGEHPEWGTWPLVADIGHPKYYPEYLGGRINLLS